MKKKSIAVKPDMFILESARLGFRLMENGDLDNLITLDTDHEIRAHFPTGISSRRECRERIEKNRNLFSELGYSDFVAIHKSSGTFAGRAGFGTTKGSEVEVGYVLMKEFWGEGLASESLVSLLAWARDFIKAKRIIAYTPVIHSASINVMKKAGMRIFKTEDAHGVECVFYEYRL